MSERSDRDYLEDILEAARRAVTYCESVTYAEFLDDTKTQDAVTRNLEIMGEAVKNLSGKTRAHYPDLPWGDIAGMRDRLIHDYFGVNWDIVWEVVKHELPQLMDDLKQILLN